jgi:ureidoacrylate peracid hydrolase
MAAEDQDRQQRWRSLGDPERDHYRLSESVVDMTRAARPPRAMRLPAEPQSIVVDLNKSALLVIDMQNDFCSKGGWFDSLGAPLDGITMLYDPISRIVKALRTQQVPIIWLNWGVRGDGANLSPVTRYPFNRVGCGIGLGDPLKQRPPQATGTPNGVLQQNTWGAAVVDELPVETSDIHVSKHRISGFWDTPLDSILRNLGVRSLFFAGINADHCVLSTLMDANFLGYDTILVEDCTATSSPDFCLQATLHNVRFCFGFTVKSADVVQEAKT